jgi:outer membrane immunogenic protein
MTLTKLLRTSAAALGALAVASVSQANAADIYSGGGMKDIPFVPPPIWTGFYIGANGGVDWAHRDDGRFFFTDQFGNTSTVLHNKLSTEGGFIGGQFGYNWQGFGSSSWVIGIEVDLDYVTMQNRLHSFGGMNFPSGPPLGVHAVGVDMDGKDDGHFGGDITGRIGWTWGSSMIYAKGGFAFLSLNDNRRESILWSDGSTSSFNGNNNDNWLTGWTVGGGIEWKVSPSWSVKLEYLHFDFGNNNDKCCNDGIIRAGVPVNVFHNNNDIEVDTVKVGFNYYWNAPPPPLPLK